MKNLLKLVLSIAVMAAVAANPVCGIAYAQEEKITNPWERAEQKTSAKKANKTVKKTNKAKKKNVKQANKQRVKKTDIAKVENKETGQKKKYLFW